MGTQYERMCCVGMCSPGLQPTTDYETRVAKGCQETSGAFQRFLFPILFILLPAPVLHVPMAISILFEVVLGLPTVDLTIVSPPLFGLVPLSVTLSFLRKCWTSAKTEGAVKSLSTAACLGQTSVLAAVNTSLSGTNADLVSPSSPQILTATHTSVSLCAATVTPGAGGTSFALETVQHSLSKEIHVRILV